MELQPYDVHIATHSGVFGLITWLIWVYLVLSSLMNINCSH